MKKILFAFLFVQSVTIASAQFSIPSKADCEKLMQRKLIVTALDDVNDNYRLNAYLKTVLTEAWKFGAVEFVTDPSDVAATIKGRKQECAVLNYDNFVANINGQKTRNGVTNIETAFSTAYFAACITLPDEDREVMEIGFPTSKLDSTDILFLGQQIQLLINAGKNEKDILAFGKTFSDFVSRKLYINEADLSEKGIEFIKKNMEHSYEILKNEDFKRVVLEQKKDGLYAKVIFSQEMKMHVIAALDIKTGRIYARAGHFGADCKRVVYNTSLNFAGICAKQLVNTLYLESEQNKKYHF